MCDTEETKSIEDECETVFSIINSHTAKLDSVNNNELITP